MGILKIVAFKLGEEEYGLDIDQVQGIERLLPITRVPNAPVFVKGVINLRGNVTPVIDLRSKLKLGQANYTDYSRVIIAKFDDTEMGLIVDQTSDVMDIAPETIEPTSSVNIDAEFFGGVAKIDGRLITLLKLPELMKDTLEGAAQQ